MTQSFNSVQGFALEIQLQALTRQLVAFLDPYDVLLTPALAERPLPIGTLDTAAPDPMSTFTRSGLFTPFTPVFNASGQPGISLPLYRGTRTDCRLACSSWVGLRARPRCWRLPRRSRRPRRGRGAGRRSPDRLDPPRRRVERWANS